MNTKRRNEITQIIKAHQNAIIAKAEKGEALTDIEKIAYEAHMVVKRRIASLTKMNLLKQ